jgi:hypothetical protein
MNPVHVFLYYFSKIHSNIIVSSTLVLSCGLFPSGSQIKFLYTILTSPILATYTAHLIFLDYIILIIYGECYKFYNFPYLVQIISSAPCSQIFLMYRVTTNYVSDYINLLVRITHIICNHPVYSIRARNQVTSFTKYLRKSWGDVIILLSCGTSVLHDRILTTFLSVGKSERIVRTAPKGKIDFTLSV